MNAHYAATAQSLTELAEALEAEAREYRETASRLLQRAGIDAGTVQKSASQTGVRTQSNSLLDLSLGPLTAESLHAHLKNKGGRPGHIAERFGVTEGAVRTLVMEHPKLFGYIERGYLRALDDEGNFIQPQASGATD